MGLQFNWLEYTAHNGTVVGSSPTKPIKNINIILNIFIFTKLYKNIFIYSYIYYFYNNKYNARIDFCS